ncbi:NAD(P)/FAD-dependent oxidoreductase [Candidatus Saccharibacteria bacterium]|nr:NAD(P)/FAD-dependent oxidoreductase [Candidatus Saccharibacteria bacterium]
MGKDYDFDYIVIGSGPAGRTASLELADKGKKVAIVEDGDFGGAELNTRDLPFEVGLDFANTYHSFVNSPAVSRSLPHFNLPTLTTAIDVKRNALKNEILKDFKAKNIKIITGFAHFLDSRTIAVNDRKYTAKNFILATGSTPKVAEISGLESVSYLTPDHVFNIHRLPRFVFIVGGGPTGVEIAEYFASLGTGVIIMERGNHLLPREDDEVADLVTNHLKNLNVTVVTGSRVTAITEDATSKIVVFMNGTSEKMVRVDSIVLATGSEPFLDYGLENAGIDYKKTGIITDKYFCTTTRHIFAIGDCIGTADSSTKRAELEAHVLVENLLHRQKSAPKYSSIARHINTHPSISVVGLNERDAVSRDLKYRKKIISLKDIPTLKYGDSAEGFVKILTDNKNRFLGSTIVAENSALALELKNILTNPAK